MTKFSTNVKIFGALKIHYGTKGNPHLFNINTKYINNDE